MEYLFSYGTLQYDSVQIANFGRKLLGTKDALSNYCVSMLQIENPDVVATSGDSQHPIIRYTGNLKDNVEGVVFEVSAEELMQADAYEVSDYKRIRVQLDSGVNAWVYVEL